LPGQDRVQVHFVEDAAPVLDPALRNHLQAGDQHLGLSPAMGLDDPDDDVSAVAALRLGGLQHLVGLADAGRRAEEDLEAAALLLRRLAQQRLGRGTVGSVGAVVAHAGFLPLVTAQRRLRRGRG